MKYPKPKWVNDPAMVERVGEFILDSYPQLKAFRPKYSNHKTHRWAQQCAMIPHINDCLMIFRQGFVFNVAAWHYFTTKEIEWGADDGVFFPMKYDGTISLWNMSDKFKETGKSQIYRFQDVADKVLLSSKEMLAEQASKFFDI